MDTVFLPESWKSWQIRKMLGEGSYGAVYLAEKTLGSDKSTSAIKIIQICPDDNEIQVLALELGNSESVRKYYEDAVQTCIQEIKAMVALKGHPNIVYIEDYAVEEDPENMRWTIYIRMEYLTPFPEYMQTHTLTESDIIRLGTDLCSALSACEKNGILHRDIKPSNIFISPATGLFKLGDFGISRKMDRSSGVYSSKGTFPYMAPEVFSGRPYDQRSDLYSLGLVLYHLLNRNREPFVDLNKQMVYMKDRENATNRRIAGETIPPPVDASPELANVITKACNHDPEKRYSNADSFQTALESVHKDKGKPKNNNIKAKVLWLILFILLLGIAGYVYSVLEKPTAMKTAPESTYAAITPTDKIAESLDMDKDPESTSIPADNTTTESENTIEVQAQTENAPQSTPEMIKVDINDIRIVPIMENKQLYYHPLTHSCVRIPIREIEKTLEEAGCIFSQKEKKTFEADLKKQFSPFCSPHNYTDSALKIHPYYIRTVLLDY